MLLCPWDSPGKDTGEGCHALLQGIFPTQGLNLHLFCLLPWQGDSLLLSPRGEYTIIPLFPFEMHVSAGLCLHHHKSPENDKVVTAQGKDLAPQ